MISRKPRFPRRRKKGGLASIGEGPTQTDASMNLDEKISVYEVTMGGKKLQDLKELAEAIRDNRDIKTLFENFLSSSNVIVKRVTKSKMAASFPALDLLDTIEGHNWVVNNIETFITYLVLFAEGKI